MKCMKHILCAMLIGIVFVPSIQAQQALIVYTSHWPPFVINDIRRPGVFCEIVSKAMAMSDYQVEYEFAPWARDFALVESGEADGLLPLAKNETRENIGLFSRPVFNTRNAVIYNTKRLPDYEYTGLESFKTHRIGGLLGWFYLKDLHDCNIDYISLRNHHNAFKMIMSDRLDLVIFDAFAGKECLHHHPEYRGNAAITTGSYSNENLYFMVSRKHPEHEAIITAFNKGLDRLDKSGFLDNIAAKYSVPRHRLMPEPQ